MRIVGALYDYLRASICGKGVHAVHDTRLIGLYAALLTGEGPVYVYAPCAEQLGQVEAQLHRLARVFQHDTIGRLAVGTAQLGAEVGILSGVGVLLCLPPRGKVLGREKLPGIELPAVHEPGGLLRVGLEHADAPAAAERRGVFVVPAILAPNGQNSYEEECREYKKA